ncbi:lysophospholipase L1-like esterase [Actinokineospora baliensis]|uniref:SGNH/GDSL hydrolase family protein n=1 Tax=Actinokineospora baliensis TaxID=547056 RepID=UPI0019576926|nr:SGNH/GDSL hydrolase family protein [Actinokineospora baliensis]MBM7774364.1 lysophospholipase L1-like esterase [Actinokineospora baliensis]
MKRLLGLGLTVAVVLGLVAPQAVAESGWGWAATWASSAQRPHPLVSPVRAVEGFDNDTVRQVVRISAGGPAVRVRLSNAHSTTALTVGGATVALAGEGAAVRPGTVRHLTFGGKRTVVIPAGGEIVTDPALLPVAPLQRLSVTLYFPTKTGQVTGHTFADASTYHATGDHRSDTAAAAFGETTQSFYYLSGVDVVALSPRRNVVVAFGDSITEGAGSTPDANNRYPDEVAERLKGRLPVVNAGIGGNRVLNDSPCFGPKGVDRFTRDALGQPGVRTVILLEGINDIGLPDVDFECSHPRTRVTAAEVIAGYRQMIHQAKSRGVRVLGGTLTPFKGFGYYSAEGEAIRDQINTWIRTSGQFDAVIDFDRTMADPADQDALNPAYDSGDHVHPNDTGYRAMANAVDLALL